MHNSTVIIVDYRYSVPGPYGFLKIAVLDRGASAGSKGYNDKGDGRWIHAHKNEKGKSFRPDKPFLAWLIKTILPYFPQANSKNRWFSLPNKNLPKPIHIKEMDVAYEVIIRLDKVESSILKHTIKTTTKPDWFSIESDPGSNSWNVNTEIIENGYNFEQDVDYENPDMSHVRQKIINRYDNLIVQLAKSIETDECSIKLALEIHIQEMFDLGKPFSINTATHGLLRQVDLLIQERLINESTIKNE